jgi:thymidylate synthase (FAD)
MNDVNFVFPPSFPKEMKEEISAYVNAGRELYNKLMEMGTPMDDARYVMPHGMETKFIVTMNGRSLMHFLKLRLGEHAQWEIKDVAMQMWTLVKDKFPVTFSDQFREFWE